MPEIPSTVIDKASWVDAKELDQHGTGMSQWEVDWLESVLQQLLAGRALTDAQRAKLEEIREARL